MAASGGRGEAELPAAFYRNSLRLAAEAWATSIAFPAISTGVQGYPLPAAARIAVATVRTSLADFAGISEVVFCCFSASDLAVYQCLLADEAQ